MNLFVILCDESNKLIIFLSLTTFAPNGYLYPSCFTSFNRMPSAYENCRLVDVFPIHGSVQSTDDINKVLKAITIKGHRG